MRPASPAPAAIAGVFSFFAAEEARAPALVAPSASACFAVSTGPVLARAGFLPRAEDEPEPELFRDRAPFRELLELEPRLPVARFEEGLLAFERLAFELRLVLLLVR